MTSRKSDPPLRSFYLTPQLNYRRQEFKRVRCHSTCRPIVTSSKALGSLSSNSGHQLQRQKLKTSTSVSLLVVDKTVVDLQVPDLNNNGAATVNLSWNIEEPTNMLDWIGLYMIGEKNPFRYLDYKCNNACSKANGAFAWKLGSDLLEKLHSKTDVKVCFKYYDGISGKLRALSPILYLILTGKDAEGQQEIMQPTKSELSQTPSRQRQFRITNVSCSGLNCKYEHELRIFQEAANRILYKSESQRCACPSWMCGIDVRYRKRRTSDSIIFEVKSESRSRQVNVSFQCSVAVDKLCEQLEPSNGVPLEINLRMDEEYRFGDGDKLCTKNPILTFNVQNIVNDTAENDPIPNNNNIKREAQIEAGKSSSCFQKKCVNDVCSRLEDRSLSEDILSADGDYLSSSESDTEMTLRLKSERENKLNDNCHTDYESRANISLEIGLAVSPKTSLSVDDRAAKDTALAAFKVEEEPKRAYGSSRTVAAATVRNCHKIGTMLTTPSPVMTTSENVTSTKNRIESGYTTDSSTSNSEIERKPSGSDQRSIAKPSPAVVPSSLDEPSTSNTQCPTSLFVDVKSVVRGSPSISSASPDAASHWPPSRTSDSGISQNLSDESVTSVGNDLERVLSDRLLQRSLDDPRSNTRSVPQTPVSFPKFRRRRPETLDLNAANDHFICGSCLKNPVISFDHTVAKTGMEPVFNEAASFRPSTSFSSSSPITRDDGRKLKILLKNSPCPDCNALKRNFLSTNTPIGLSALKSSQNFGRNGIEQLDMILPAFCEARMDAHGRIFYVDHLNKTTSWHRPRLFKQSLENVRKLDQNKRVIYHRKTIGSAFERSEVAERTSKLPTEWPAITFLLRQDFIALLQSNNKAKEIYDNSQSVRHIIHRVRKDSDKFDRFQYNKDLIALLNEFADKTQGMPTDWELKIDASGREFFVDHKFKRTTFIDPRLPKNTVFHRHHRAKSAPPADSEDGLTDFEQLTYNDKVVRFLRKPESIELIFSRLTHQFNQAKLRRKLETIVKSGVQALKKYVNDVDLIMALSACEEEILSDTTRLTVIDKSSSSISKATDFDLKLTDFYLRLGENGLGQGPEKIKLVIRRKHLLADAFDSIMSLKRHDLQKSKLYINFDDEAGLDYGGPSREFFFLLSRELFNPYYGLFEYSSSKVYNVQISPMSVFVENYVDWFRFSGRILALALMHRFLIDVFFTRTFYKLLLKKACSISDLEGSDDQFYASLLWIQTNEVSPSLELTFSVNEEIGGQITEKELIPNGPNIAVNESNKLEYINHLIKWRLERGVKKQSNALLCGFYEVNGHYFPKLMKFCTFHVDSTKSSSNSSLSFEKDTKETRLMDVNRCGGPETMTLIEQPRTLLMNNLLAASAASMNKSPPSSASDQQPILSAMHPMIVINNQDPQQQDDDDDEYIDEEEAQRRRESLARRPSYRRIVNDLYGAEMSIPSVCKLENIDADTSDDDDDDSTNNMNTAANLSAQAGGALAAATNLSSAVLPCISGSNFGDSLHYNASNILSLPGSLHLTCSATNGGEPNYTTSTIGLMSPGAAGNLVHYQTNSNQHQQQHLHDCMTQSQHIVVPVNGDLLGLRPVTSNGGNQNLLFASGLPQVSGAGTISSSNVHHQQQAAHQQSSQQQPQHHVRSTGNHDEAIRKREVRLLKNREAAKECRRKKKEYVKCLENRVAALEQQNKQLIEELKTLKDLYCQKGD